MTTEQRYEKTFNTGDRCELTLVNVRGGVHVLGWDRPEVSVVAVKRLGSYMGAQQAYDETFVAMDQDGPAVSLRTRTARGFNPFFWMGLGSTQPEVEYTVRVPRQGEVAVRCVGGLLEIKDVSGSIYARTVNGDIYLERLTGSIIVHGVNGRVSAQQVSGNLGARTVDSSIGVRQSSLTSLSARTVSGDVTLESPLATDGSYTVRTVSGDLHLHLTSDTRATLELVSTSGSIRSDLPCQILEQRRGSWRVTLNGGGPPVEMRSVSGGILVGLAGADRQAAASEAAPAAAEPSSVEAGPEARQAEPAGKEAPELVVLRAVERGEMSVDEALKQLEDLMGQ